MRIWPCSSPSSSRSRCCTAQRAHRPVCSRPGCPQPGQVRQNPGSARTHSAQRGSPQGAATNRARSGRQLAHRAQRWWQARHHGLPVAARHGAGAVASADRAGHRLHRPADCTERPVVGADADRAAATAVDAGFLVGRIGDQAVGTQRLAVFVAGGGLADGPAPRTWLRHGTWRCSCGTTTFRRSAGASGITRPQRGTGRAHDASVPRRRRACRSAAAPTGTGASAPAPVSRSGRSCSAQARRWRCPACGAAAMVAAPITSADSVGSASG